MALEADPDQDNQQQPQSAVSGLIQMMSADSTGDVGEAFSVLGPGHGSLAVSGGAMMYTAPGKITPVNLTENMKIGLDYFKSQDWTEKQASGIMANGVAESGLNPNNVGDGGAAHGVFQWHPNRYLPLLDAYAKDPRMGASPTDTPYIRDLKMMNYELKYGAEKEHGAILATKTGAGESGAYFSAAIERPAAVVAAMNERGNGAERIMAGIKRDEAKIAATDLNSRTQLGPYTSAHAAKDLYETPEPKPSGAKLDEEKNLTAADTGKLGTPGAGAVMTPKHNFPMPSPLSGFPGV